MPACEQQCSMAGYQRTGTSVTGTQSALCVMINGRKSKSGHAGRLQYAQYMLGGNVFFGESPVQDGCGNLVWFRTDIGYHRGISDRNGVVDGIVAGELVVEIIVGGGSVIAGIVHGDELEKTNGLILPVMLKIMRYQPGQFQQLTDLCGAGNVHSNQ